MSGFARRRLGKTGLEVSPLGIGGGSAIQNDDLLYAFERGINYFFYSSDLHHHLYRQSSEAIKTLCSSGSSVRDKVVLATVSYVNDPEKIFGVLLDQFMELKIDYIDVFHWGWITDKTDYPRLYQVAHQLKKPALAKALRPTFFPEVEEINQELLKRGLVRYVGASFHSRQAARASIKDLEVMMLRYNLAHLGVESEVFPYLSGDKTQDPGVVAFNVAHEGHKFMHIRPKDFPSDAYVPSIPDCYRYALTNPAVDLVLTGINSREQVDEGIAAMERGPLSDSECEYLRHYGNFVAGKINQMPLTV